eukprot:TRINITY_DN2108_c0_g1_i2.p1 TRINITY_DN2108_c0_g1~~TRINITY_DN2108_c0_g1_i2.p1  ORF type:complete len:158 (-),score=70.14 TRINITY_DN2108_c0_g1_i2:147-566(-)
MWFGTNFWSSFGSSLRHEVGSSQFDIDHMAIYRYNVEDSGDSLLKDKAVVTIGDGLSSLSLQDESLTLTAGAADCGSEQIWWLTGGCSSVGSIFGDGSDSAGAQWSSGSDSFEYGALWIHGNADDVFGEYTIIYIFEEF